MISICCCSWNDLPFLKILYKSLKRNTRISYEFIVHNNGSTDGTNKWLKENKIKHSFSKENEGVAAVNYSVEQAKYPYICDINSDMYVLPGWDVAILKQIKDFEKQKIDKWTISSCLIEPKGCNPEYTIVDCGTTPETFNEEKLLSTYLINASKIIKPHTNQYSHPISMPKILWEEMGGVDTEYPFGLATDHDIAARAYSKGCRHFKMLGNSRVYHFIGQTISKIPNRPNAEPIFKQKWDLTIQEFRDKMNIAKLFKRVEDGIF